MHLTPCPKAYRYETQRAVSPEETLARVERVLPAAGITRVADITNLDRIGIPVFSSIRPTAHRGAISVYNGKGATPVEARVSAIMEGIERYSAEVSEREIIHVEYRRLAAEENTLYPSDLILPQGIDPDGYLPWVRGYDIAREEEIYVPAQAVFHPYPPDGTRLFRTTTNGLASGNTREEAIFHGLMEVIERDAWSLAEASRNTGPRVVVDTGGIGEDLLKRFTSHGVEITVKNITSDVGIPTIAAAADDVELRDPRLLTIGMGSHTNAGIALLRALTEVAQSRLTQIHGAREDTTSGDMRTRIGYDRTKRMNGYWFAAGGDVALSSIPSCDTDDFLTDIRAAVRRLGDIGLSRVIVVDLTSPQLQVPVVRVIVPGLEAFAMDQERSGDRCRHARTRRVPRTEP